MSETQVPFEYRVAPLFGAMGVFGLAMTAFSPTPEVVTEFPDYGTIYYAVLVSSLCSLGFALSVVLRTRGFSNE